MLHERIDLFRVQKIDFYDVPHPPACVETLWRTFGVGESVLALFVEVGAIWTGSFLLVLSTLRGDPELCEKVSTCVAYCLRLVNFSLTRWVKGGRCGRFFIRSLLLGGEGLWKIACDDEAVMEYHLHLFAKASPKARKFLAILALSSFPAESMQLEVLIDDRLLLRATEYKQTIHVEMVKRLSPPLYIFERVSSVVNDPDDGAWELRHCVIRSALIACGYAYRGTFVSVKIPVVAYPR